MNNHSTKQIPVFLIVFMTIYLITACSSNESRQQQHSEREPPIDTLLIATAIPDSCEVDSVLVGIIDTTAIQSETKLVAASGKIEAVNIDSIKVKLEAADKKVGKAAGGSVGQNLQNAFNHISNETLDSREKLGIIKGIQKKFLDMREDRVFVTSIEGNNNQYGIGEYLRRLKGYEAIKIRIEKIQLAEDTLVANITVKEVKK